MTRKDRIAVGALVGAFLATQFEAHRILRKYNVLVEIHNDLLEEHSTNLDAHKALHNTTIYVLNVLGREGIDVDEILDEFDLIALKNLAPTPEES